MRITYAVFFWMLTLLLFLSLYTYDPMDVAYYTTHPNNPPVNSVGVVGAWTAFRCFFELGFGAYLLLFVLFVIGCAVGRGDGGSAGAWCARAGAGAVMVISLCALLQLPHRLPRLTESARAMNLVGPGGRVGDAVSSALALPYLGYTGATAAWGAVFLAAAAFFTRFTPLAVVAALFRRGAGALGRSAKISAEVLSHRRRVIPLGIRTVRVRPLERLRRRAGKIKVAAASQREVQPELPVERAGERPGRAPRLAPMPRFRRPRTTGAYRLPGIDLLRDPVAPKGRQEEDLDVNKETLLLTLREFGIEAQVGEAIRGPVITRYEVRPAPGVKVQSITALADDLALAMAATSIRIVAPIPGKQAVGIEIPNVKATLVGLKEMLQSREYRAVQRFIPLALGKEISGNPIVGDLREMPHLLIAGSTGSGKTVCINSIILTMLFACTPDELKLILVDPKRVEMSQYRDIPHLITPVVTESKMVSQALRWAGREMEKRYNLFSRHVVRDILGYNTKVGHRGADMVDEEGAPLKPLPFIVVIIDELADLMLVARKEIEDPIIRLAQMGRAAGIHIILATQRPSVNVITGLIKANFPTRIAFKVASKVDSKVILDGSGADKLLGKGDMIFMPPGASRRLRVQGTLVGDDEINAVARFVKAQSSPEYLDEILLPPEEDRDEFDEIDDDLYNEAVKTVRQFGQASASMLQRRHRIGYNRAARLIDMMEERGVVGPQQGSRPREIL